FDFFTKFVTISGVFSDGGGTISIAEVEFLEEVQAGEISVRYFNLPYGGTGPTTDAFEWSSETDDFIGDTLSFALNSYAFLTAFEMQFPTGDTYKYDIVCYNEDDMAFAAFTDLESTDMTGWQSFDLTSFSDQEVTA
ncbi:unnamed protein product, partial [Pylaiella littoralis]